MRCLCMFAMLIGMYGIVMGCRSYRYSGFDAAPELLSKDVKLVVTNLILNVKPDESAWLNFSESMSYDTFSVLQSAKAAGVEDLRSCVNAKLSRRANMTAKEYPVKVIIDVVSVENDKDTAAYWCTIGIAAYKRCIDERCKVTVYADDGVWSGVLHVRGEGRRTAFSPGGLFSPETPNGATYTQMLSGISWRDFLGAWFPCLAPYAPYDVLACDLADVLLKSHYGN